MYASVEEWREEARQPLEEWIGLRQYMAALEARSVDLLARVIDAHRWPGELPLPGRCDTLRAQVIQGGVFAEDLTSEIAVALKTSVGAAERLVGDIIRLEDRLPRCWAKVVTGQAELWQARKIVDACGTIPALGRESIPGIDVAGLPGTGGTGLPDTGADAGADTGDGTGTGADGGTGTDGGAGADAGASVEVEDGDEAGAGTGDGADPGAGPGAGAGSGAQTSAEASAAVWAVVDGLVGPSLGVVGPRRFFTTLDAAMLIVDPGRKDRGRGRQPDRFVRTGHVKDDPDTSWVYARLDPADVVYLEATTQLLADLQASQGDTRSNDARRATAFGRLGNPAAVVQTLGVHTTRGLDPVPQSDEDTQVIMDAAARLAPLFTPRTQVYVHLVPDALADPDTVTRVEEYGPVLARQIAALTQGSKVRVTPVVHVDGAGITVDQYEIPHKMREHVLLAHPQECFPYSSRETRHLDLDHIRPYVPGLPGQTSPANLAPLSRRAHRLKTHAGWQFDHPDLGTYVWRSPAGQQAVVSPHGTIRYPARQ